jgi:hypothetical protein
MESATTASEKLEPRLAAERLWRERYPEAQLLFCGGSVVRGEGLPSSDLDVVVLFERVERAFRDSFYFAGWPIEVFVHDHETLAYFFDHDEKRGRPVLAQIVAEGLAVPGLDESSDRLQAWARERVKADRGVPPPDAFERARYAVTDLLDDFRDERPRVEQVSVACALYPEICQFVLAGRGAWDGDGKTLPRKLRALDPELASLLEHGFERFFREGDRSDAIAAVERALEPFGGKLFEGYRSDAPAEWRVPRDLVPWLK